MPLRRDKDEDKKRRSLWPWARDNSFGSFTNDDRNYAQNYHEKLPKFYGVCYDNAYLDINTKRAAVRASPSVVSLVIFSDEKEISQGSGTIIEGNGIILTSAKLIQCPSSKNVVDRIKVVVHLHDGRSYDALVLACDFYYNIVVVKIQSKVPLPEPASLRPVDDCISVDPNELCTNEDIGFQLRPHRDNAYVLTPGDQVIALGRYFIPPYDIMVAPGLFRIKCLHEDYDIAELFQTSCIITSTGVGGPLVNRYGEVIGIMIGEDDFLPINIILLWWEHYKSNRELHRPPYHGMLLSNLYAVHVEVMDKVVQKPLKNFTGVIVEKVLEGSNADAVGICPSDLIVECCGKVVCGFLEFYNILWDNIGNAVELVVVRASVDARLKFYMMVKTS